MSQLEDLINLEKYVEHLKARIGKIVKPRKFVGLAVEDNGLLAADVRREKDGFKVTDTKHFLFPEGHDFKDPEKLGRALGVFLQENKFSGRKAIIGIPAKWLMMREKTFPVSTKDSMAGMLKIYAEREFSLSPDDLALDYTASNNAGTSTRIVLSAMLRSNLEQIMLAVRWAGLDIFSVTASSIALFALIRSRMPQPAPKYFLYIRPDFAEFIARDKEQTLDVKYFQKDIKSETGAFISELRRIMAYYSNGPDDAGEGRLLIWNASGDAAREELKAIADSMPPRVKMALGDSLSYAGEFGLQSDEKAYPLIAPALLGQSYTDTDPFHIDFLNTRMNLKPGMIKKNQILWASAVSAAVLIFLVVMLFTWRSDKKDVNELKAKLDEMQGDISSAKDIIKKVATASSWYSDRPKVLDCLKELASTFPEEGRIWVTNLAFNEKMKGVISGRASDEQSIIDVLDKLKANHLFNNVQMIYLQSNSQSAQEVSFSMNFSFTGKE